MKEKVLAYYICEASTDPIVARNIRVHDKGGSFYITFDTVLQTFNVMNRNKRIYESDGMKSSLFADHILELQQNKSWCGEAGHPMGSDLQRSLTIDPKCISHKIDKHWITGNTCEGTITTLDDDALGKKMAKIILQGLNSAFSLRAVAPLTKRPDGVSVVKGKSHIVTYDWVILPSHKEAYQKNNEPLPLSNMNSAITSNGNTLKESCTVIENLQIAEYIATESANVAIVSNLCDIDARNITVSMDKQIGRAHV